MSETIHHLEVYQRIKNGKPYCKNLKQYSKKIIEGLIEMLINDDESEKCLELKEFIKKRYNHEKNYTI